MSIKCNSIYKSALKLLDDSGLLESCDDMEERATFLIATFCEEVRELDSSYRFAHGLSKHSDIERVSIGMDEDLPVCSRFVPAASYSVAAMLIIDENPELSDKLFERYCDSISSISMSLPCRTDRIVNVYEE